MTKQPNDPDEKFLTESAQRQVEADNRERPDDQPMGPVGNVPSRAESEGAADAGLTEASMPGQGPTADDAAPETLMPDDGSRSATEAGAVGRAADEDLTEVGKAGAGGRYGLDEAELGRVDPLDGKPWDGNPNDPLEPETAVDPDFPAADESSEPDQE